MSEPSSSKVDPSSIFAALFVIALLVGIPLFVYKTCSGTSPLREETEAFFAALSDGPSPAAYQHLATSRQQELSEQAFAAALDKVPFRGHSAIDVNGTQNRDDEWGCTRGDIVVGDDEWSFMLYLVREGEAWRVHTWAVHPPAVIAPMRLIERCGNW